MAKRLAHNKILARPVNTVTKSRCACFCVLPGVFVRRSAPGTPCLDMRTLRVDCEPTWVFLQSAKRGFVDDNIMPKKVRLAPQSVATSLTSPRLVSHAFHLVLARSRCHFDLLANVLRLSIFLPVCASSRRGEKQPLRRGRFELLFALLAAPDSTNLCSK